MSATGAEIGYGMLLKMLTSTGPDVYTTLGKQRDVMPPDGFSVDLVDATHNESDNATEEVIPGIVRTKSVTVEIEYNMNDSTVQLIQAAKRLKKTFRCVHPTGKYIQFDGYIEDFEPEAPTEDKQIATLTIKRSGSASVVAASTPTNLVLPAISGEIDEGDVLTAFEGEWANEPTSFTYVWENAGSPIEGATSKTYTVQASDAGDEITVVVTATNSAGSTAAESAPVVMASGG
jgi:dihydroxyacetone kinase-like predicted kinase